MQKKEPEVSDTVWKEFANGDAIEKRREEKRKKRNLKGRRRKTVAHHAEAHSGSWLYALYAQVRYQSRRSLACEKGLNSDKNTKKKKKQESNEKEKAKKRKSSLL